MSNASNLSTLANVLDDGSSGQFLKSTGSGGVAFDTVAAGAVVYATADLLPLSGFAAGDMAYVTATNRFYINNGSGWYSISLVNTNPNITSVQDAGSNTTPFTLATDGTATVITVTAADPEDVPVTYGYSVTTGNASLNGSTVAQGTGSNTNVFTVTPHASQDATFTITFTASDGINQATSANAFSLSFVTTVTNSKYTTLLATATSTGANSTIEDSSTANSGSGHSITVNGDAYAGTFSPHRSGGYATSFSRSASSKLEIASMPAIGSGDCSIEFWCKIDSQVWNGIISRGAYNSSGTFSLSSRSGDTELTLIWSGTIYTTSGANINVGEWKWVQIIRSSGTVTVYVNGSSVGSWSNSSNVNSTSNYVIGRVDSSDYFGGDLRDLRISTNAQSSSNGSEKLVTDSNTTFLSCHLPYLSYATSSVASNTYSSISGTIKTVSNSPYDYEKYSATDHGGSILLGREGYTTGGSTRLDIASSSDFAFGTGDYTIDVWVKPQLVQVNLAYFLLDFNTDSTLRLNDGVFKYTTASPNQTPELYNTGSGPVLANVWSFLSISRHSGVTRMFLNGVMKSKSGSTSGDGGNFGSASVKIGARASNNSNKWNGEISDLRIINGTSLYQSDSSFTPPTSPLITVTNTKLHIKGTDASIIDKSQGSNLKLIGAVGSTGQVRLGAWANTKTMYFDGTDDYIIGPTISDLNIGTGDFTVECWLHETTANTNKGIWDGRSTYNTTDGFTFIRYGTDTFRVYSGSVLIDTGSFTIQNQWVHCALVRSNGVLSAYINGNRSGTPVSNSTNFSSSGTLKIGGGMFTNSPTPNAYITGYIQDFRVSNFARYTASDETSNIPTAPLEG